MLKTSTKVKVLIIGGGLSGLHTAYELNQRGVPFQLIEARQRLGGRILSKTPITHRQPEDQNYSNPAFDLGPSWFWPHQSRIQALLGKLGLLDDVYEQAYAGHALYEDHSGHIHQGFNGASMRGSYRIKGGINAIITQLDRHLPSNTCLTQSTATQITFAQQALTTHVISNNEKYEIKSDFVVLALPPRLAAHSIQFTPQLSRQRLTQLKSIGTWMAAHAKVAVLYSNPFWQNQGLSGDAISQKGPLQEIHDASSADNTIFGLIGFVSVSAQDRHDKYDDLRSAIITQLIRLFGDAAASPLDVYIKDWAFDPFTSTIEDRQQMMFHPSDTLEPILESGWDKRLIWSGSETAGMGERNNGYLEGALEASERSLNILTKALKSTNGL